jgi:hypothetical protein
MADKEKSNKSTKAKPNLKITKKKTIAVGDPIVTTYEDDYNKISPVYNPAEEVKTPSPSMVPYAAYSPSYEGPPPSGPRMYSGPRTPEWNEGPKTPEWNEGPKTPEWHEGPITPPALYDTKFNKSSPRAYPPVAETKQQADKHMHRLLNLYLANITKDSSTEELELEVKFSTIGFKPITRINFDNIIKKLLSLGFKIDYNVYLLRVQNEYLDPKTGTVRLSNVRTEISGLQNIRTYCQTNSLTSIESGVQFIMKNRFENETGVNVNDFNFRVSLNKEIKLSASSPMVRSMLDKWNDQKKTFRYLNRLKLRHPYFPVIVDMSIVKDSKKQGRFYVPEYTIHDAGVFNAQERFEVEIEVLNKYVGIGTEANTPDALHAKVLKPVIKYVLSGLQETNYPIGYAEQQMVLQSYMVLLWGKDYRDNMRINASSFVGPSSYTLEMRNIRPLNTDSVVPNIRDNYTVTDKADGERKLLFISPEGKIYLINTNMDVQFTGTVSKTKEVWNSILDGEHILYDKKKKFINMYAAFDVYYIAAEDVRAKAFVSTQPDEESSKFRLPLLETLIGKLNAVSIVNPNAPTPLKITKKRFYSSSLSQSIFQGCGFILKKEHDGLFEYETDGLIFTPANKGVNSDKIGEYIKPYKMTWDYSFKWKPAKFNTIDFLVSVKKNANGTDFIGSIFQNGTDVRTMTQIPEYKSVILRVGFDESNPKHALMNPYQDAIDDKLPTGENNEHKEKYVPMQFYPTEPSDYKAGLCNLPLRDADKNMYTEADEVIEDNMIVEFRYELDKEEQWRWIPLRVRYDKTAQLRAGEKNYGNAYHVANSNWHSIHNPITQGMIMTGEGIPEELGDDDVYYNKVAGVSRTAALRDFHNLYVKNLLISSVAKPGGTLIDLAVGKGGDFPKWINSRLKFVFGVDISRDNIQNRLNGAYARYINYRKRYKVMPDALFVNGNSSVNIKKTTGILVDKDKQITRAVFGQGPKDSKLLGQGVYKQYGVAAEGFDVCSIQFAIHYMFENQETLQNFLQNVSEVTKEGGYFIGTSYDGEKMFNYLKGVEQNDSKVIMSGDESTGDRKKMWEVIKRYDRDEFNNDETCVGYAIDVFQETINKTFREYLVNYTYLTRVLENYGFVPVSSEELQKMNSPFKNSSGLFSELFNKMNDDIKKNPRLAASYEKAPDMSDAERTISFLNRYFIYKKVRKVSDAEKVSLQLQHKISADETDADEVEMTKEAKQAVVKALGTTATTATTATVSKKPAKPRVKLAITKKATKAAAALSTIIESEPPATAAAAATVATAALPNAEAEKQPVKKLKKTVKLKI